MFDIGTNSKRINHEIVTIDRECIPSEQLFPLFSLSRGKRYVETERNNERERLRRQLHARNVDSWLQRLINHHELVAFVVSTYFTIENEIRNMTS